MAGLGNLKLDSMEDKKRLADAKAKTEPMEEVQNAKDQAHPIGKVMTGHGMAQDLLDSLTGSSTKGLSRPRMSNFVK